MRYLRWIALVALMAAGGCPGPDQERKPTRRISMPEFTETEIAAAEPLTVVAATPTGIVEGRGETEEITVTFGSPMVPLEAGPETVDFPLLLEPDVPGTCHWLGTRSVIFRPDTLLPVATGFTVTIPRGVKSVEGSMLKRDHRFGFSTVGPRLVNSSPYHNQKLVELGHWIWLEFNVPMVPSRARRFIRLVEPDGAERAFSLRQPRQGEAPDEWWYNQTDSANTLVVIPRGGLRIQTEYEVVLEKGLLAREGNLGLERERRLSFKTFNRFRFEGVPTEDAHHPEDELEFMFSNPVSHSELAQWVRFRPALKIPDRYEDYTYASQRPDLSLAFEPEATYEVTLSRWLKDRFGNRLGRDVGLKLRTASYRPAASMPTGRGIVESESRLRHPVWMVNIDSVRVRMRRLDRGEVVPFWNQVYEDGYWDEEPVEKPYCEPGFFTYEKLWRPQLQRNRRTLLPLELGPGIGERRSGFLFCELDMLFEPHRGSRFRRAFLQVTPYGLTAKFSPENGLAYVSRLRDATAVSGARIELRDDRNRVVWTGRTDSAGFAELPGWDELGVEARNEWSSPRVWLFGQDDSGEAFVHSEWGTGIYPFEFGISYDWNPDPGEPKGFLFTDKGLYKAGDTVRIKGMVRAKRAGRWTIPSQRAGRLQVTDSRGEAVLDTACVLSERGSFDVLLSLDGSAVSGYYSTEYELDEYVFYGSFRVEAYRPAEFEVEVEADQGEYVAGDRFEARASGRYLFGAPMAGDAYIWTVSLSPTSYAPPGHDGFSWGPSMDEGADGHRVLASGSGRLDRDGQARIGAKLDPGRGTRTGNLTCEATVTAQNERSIAGRESWILHRAEFYVGAKADAGFIEVGDSLGFELLAAKPNGELIPRQDVSVTVLRRVWKSARKAQTGGRYSWVSEPHDEKVAGYRVRTGTEPVLRWFKPKLPGYYWLKCEARDRRRNPVRTDCTFWVAGSGEAAWMMRDDDMVELVRDKDSYEPGDTARVMVKSPWQEVRAVVTVEREHVLDHFQTEVKGNAEVIRIPVRAEYLPNVFVSVVLLKGRTTSDDYDEQGQDLGKPGFKVGYVELPVDPASRRLEVVVSADREEYRPGEKVSLSLRVADATGRGRGAELTLAVVDLGVLKLTGFKTPDPFGVFYAWRPLSVATVESRTHVMGQRSYGEKGESPGGDGENGRFVRGGAGEDYEFSYRQKFLETALWLPSVRTDATGRAKVDFELPDNLTTWQVMAVAGTVEEFGSGDATFRVNKPLLIQPSLPRFVRPDDRFQAGVMVHNRSGQELAVRVSARAAQGVELAGPATREIRVQANQPVEVMFEYRCSGGDSAEFLFEARANGEEDALRLSLPVRNPPATEAVAVYEQTEDSLVTQWVSAPADVFSGVGGLEVSVASSGLAGLERGVEYLRTYPYECLEQRLSKVLPFIVGADIINQFKLSGLTGRRLREFVAAELSRVPEYQDESGGFHFWTGSRHWWRPSPYLSAYCIYTLALAKRNGYEVDDRVAEKGRSYLLGWLGHDGENEDWPYSVDERLTARALAVYALGLWDVGVESYISGLVEHLDQLSVFGKACLLKAVSGAGPRLADVGEVEDRIVQALTNKIKQAPTTAHFEEDREGGWTFHSNVRTSAAVLQALLEARGEVEFAEKVVRWLVSERKAGRWRTTQENVHVFDALATFYRVYEKVRPEFGVTLQLEGRTILATAFSGRQLESRRGFVPIGELPADTQQVRVMKRGPGRLYYGMRLTYAPKGELKPKDEGFRVEKKVEPVRGRRESGYCRGQQYLVTLNVYTAQERLYVVLDDPLPAGFEIVNTSFATESRESGEVLAEARRAGRKRSWWGSFDHEETYDDRYVLFATSLRKGWHSRTYLVKALTPGRFFMPATRMEEMYTPEVFGRTGQGWLEVR